MRRKAIIGNWKMNGLTTDLGQLEDIEAEAKRLSNVDVAISLPVSLIAMAHARYPSLTIGAQDCHHERAGAFTGSISAGMLRDAGARFTLLGHSERRQACGESNAVVRAKAGAALDAGLHAVVCVGETARERADGDAVNAVAAQVRASVPPGVDPATIILAYEPVWAIGTGNVPHADDLATMYAAIRRTLSDVTDADGVRILYGGSVTTDSVAMIAAVTDIDGVLVGGASLSADSFVPIIRAIAEPTRLRLRGMPSSPTGLSGAASPINQR